MSGHKDDVDPSSTLNDDSAEGSIGKRKVPPIASSQQPMYYVSGHNGINLVEKALVERGWRRCAEKTHPQVKVFWTELVGQVNYSSLRDGEQMANHIPNCGLITNKLGLLLSLRDYERTRNNIYQLNNGVGGGGGGGVHINSSTSSSGSTVLYAQQKAGDSILGNSEDSGGGGPQLSTQRASTSINGPFSMHEFVPETYIVDDAREREQFFAAHQEGDIWIYKPTGSNQGKGISLVQDLPSFKESLRARDEESKRCIHGIKARIVQRYLKQPLLVHNRKFDIRCYLLIASTVPYVVLFHPGYLRLSIHEYTLDIGNLTVHLTNQYIQKKDPAYHDVKDDTVWSMQKFNQYVNENIAAEKKLPQDWVLNGLEKQMQKIMLHVFNSVKSKLCTRLGLFELYGFDFMIDESMKVWLIEVNVNPAMHTNCQVLNDLLPGLIAETLDIALECFDKTKRDKPILPLQSLRKCVLLYHQGNASRQRYSPQANVNYWQPPRFRSHSQSPHRIAAEPSLPVPSVDIGGQLATSGGGGGGATNSNDRPGGMPALTAVFANRNFENSLRRYERRNNWNYKSLPRNSPSYLPPVYSSNPPQGTMLLQDANQEVTVKRYTFRPSVGSKLQLTTTNNNTSTLSASGNGKRQHGGSDDKSPTAMLHSSNHLPNNNNGSNSGVTREVVKLSTVQVVTNDYRAKMLQQQQQQQQASATSRPMPDTSGKKSHYHARRLIDFSA